MPESRELRILIVDDRQDDAELMTAALEQAMPGCAITAACSAEEGQARASEKAWSLILVDYKLPRQTGLELLPKLQRAAPTAAIIMLTGHGDERVAVEAMRMGASYYLKKSPALLTELPLVVNEVLEKWRLRQELDLAHSRLHSLINHVNDIIYELDAEGRLTFISREVEWSLGYNPGELLGTHFSSLLAAGDVAKVGRMFAERRTGARATRGLEVSLVFKRGVDVHLHTRGGEVRLFEVNAAGLYDSQRTFLGTAGVARDITKRKQDEAARREFESRLKTVLDLASDAIFLKSVDGRYLLANPAARRVLGRLDDQVLGKTDAELLDPATAAQFMETDREVLATGRRVERLEKEQRPNGEVRVWHTVKTVHRGEDGRPLGVFGISRDVTEQIRKQEENHHAEKLRALGQLVAGVAHELNNPLTTIIGHAHLLYERSHDDPECHQAAEIIADHAERTSRIVRDLVAFARPQPPNRSAVSLNELVAEDLRAVGPELAAHAIEVTLDLAPGLPSVSVDARQIQQLLTILVTNARQAMWEHDRGGRLTVRTRAVPAGREAGAAPAVRVEVCDTGPGVPEQLAGQIFTPFFTTKPVGQGTGLGLAIAYSIVKEHGGSIAVDRAPAGGARFTVTLPLGAGGGEAAAPAPPPAPARAVRILVLEDERPIRELMTAVLTRAGHQVTAFRDGEAALSHLQGPGAPPDLILSDVKMPGMGGEEFFSRLQAAAPALRARVLFCTGDTMDEATARLIRNSGHPPLAKPFTPAMLLAAVAAALARAPAEGGPSRAAEGERGA